MEEETTDHKGFVYILEVKDIVLPVCKIGMTTRTPFERCAEINNSSTGDFIWSVAHYIYVDNCRKLESLVHSKLAPLRQKGREFFNLNADDAYKALISIFENQSRIKKLKIEENLLTKAKLDSRKKPKNKNHVFKRIDTKYADLLQCFSSLINVKGRPFGQLNKPSFGISDGKEGVQWNLKVSTDSGDIFLGVNLEGLKYRDWPISKFILSEIESPKIDEIKGKVDNPNNIFICFTRDAWQATSRPSILEKYIGDKEYALSEINKQQWSNMLKEALGCLNKDANFRGRTKQVVTLKNKPQHGEQVRYMEVSPHLTIRTPLSLTENMHKELERKISELKPVYEWVKYVSEA